jgi:hydrogenase 3 maturation protease
MGTEGKQREQLRKICERKTLVVGIGNTLKGDDGAGCFVCERLQDSCPGLVIDAGTVPENYIGPIIERRPEVLVVVDAIDFGGTAGEIRIFKPEDLSSAAISTHTLSPRLFLDVIYKSIEVEVWFVGIGPGQTVLGEGLSKEVEEAVEVVAGILAEELAGKAEDGGQ